MSAIRLRRARPIDAAALGEIHVASWRETYFGILPDHVLASLSVAARTAMWRRLLDDPANSGGTDVYVAEDHEVIKGFGSCCQQRDERLVRQGFGGEISAIYVLRSHQRLGLGRSIMSLMAQAPFNRGGPQQRCGCCVTM